MTNPAPQPSKPTVAVGLSGGVDSTMAACLLLQQGYAVTGITMQIWDGPPAAAGRQPAGCYGPGAAETLQAARSMAARLGIRHLVIPLADEFRTWVFDYFRREYLAGRTPNPCTTCNKRLKFGFLLDKARRLGVEFERFATGHYARVEYDARRKRCLLRRGLDRRKDQAYFLAGLTQEQLRRAMFPLGALTKSRVKALAREFSLGDAAEKRESQDFFKGADYAALFPGQLIRPGPILDRAGRVLGQHRGIAHYTIGQRKGLGLSGTGAPLYVLAIDGPRNTLVAGPRRALLQDRLLATDINWIGVEELRAPRRVQVQIRHQHPAADATLTPLAEAGPRSAAVRFDRPQMAIAPGQSVVFYADDLVIGGGTIGPAGPMIP